MSAPADSLVITSYSIHYTKLYEVSEYRIESGLNCGGHAFASKGYLLGPILEEFKEKKAELTEKLYAIYAKAAAALV